MVLLLTASGAQGLESQSPPPIIDVHMHAFTANWFGPAPIPVCIGDVSFLGWDPRDSLTLARTSKCTAPLQSAESDEALMLGTIGIMERYNVTGVASGPITVVRGWKAAAPHRVIPALLSGGQTSLDSIRAWAADGSVRVLGELTFQYGGLAPSDSIPDAYFALAEELDLPVGIHVGLGPPGAAYLGSPGYRMRLSNPLLLEDALLRHPRLRLYVMHAGWPMLDEMIGLLYAHPQVYVDISVIDWVLPRAAFHQYLRRLVDAGFAQRIMFGSDQMIWPEALRLAIQGIESAEFLSIQQKRDIFYNNAAKFFRLGTQPAPSGVPR